MADPVALFLQRALASGSRSTVLKPLAWLIGLCASASIASFSFSSPVWLGSMFGVLGGVTIVLYFVSYIYFGITDKDALRSERYSIQKLAIQRGLVGDDDVGYIEVETAEVKNSLSSSPLVTTRRAQDEQEALYCSYRYTYR